MDITLKISERLTDLINDKGLDSKTFSKAIGVSESTVSRWKSNSKYMLLSGALKIVDYFNCSLDFLVGRSEILIDFVPQKDYPPFYEHLKKIMEKRGITRYELNNKTTIKSSHLVDWNKGADPHILSLIELADYLEITLDFLVGRDR